jgi:hypothetical protein
MSRRRTTDDAPLGHLWNGSRRAEKGLFPADKAAMVHLIDPERHTLATIGRYLNEGDPGMWWIDRNDYLLPPEDESQAGFLCKACRDKGLGWQFAIPAQECERIVSAVWEESRASGTPRRGTFTVEPL